MATIGTRGRAVILLLGFVIGQAAVGLQPQFARVEPVSRELGLVDVVLVSAEPTLASGGNVALVGGERAPTAGGVVFHWRGDAWRARISGVRPDGGGLPSEIERWVRGERESVALEHEDWEWPERGVVGVPGWAMGEVWYQIFPERFANGEPGNDPRGQGVYLAEWSGDWSEVTADEVELAWARGVGEGRSVGGWGRGPMRSRLIWNRRYGGDLQGVVGRLDELQSLGVTGLYFCPVFASSSLHKYDAADHRHIDPSFGGRGELRVGVEGETADPSTWGWTEADRYFVDVLLPEARKRGMRVVIDGVWNHVGLDHWAFRDVVERGALSAYADWFDVRFGADGSLVEWQGWDGKNGRLPEFRQTSEGDLVAPVKEHVFAVTRRWMDPNGDGDPSDGVDGWRLDVAPEIGLAFWGDWRRHVRSINPEALLIGELWFRGDDYFGGAAFDAAMNYPFAYGVVGWLGGDLTSEEAVTRLRYALNVPADTALAQYTLLDSHDTDRVASMLMNPGREYDNENNTLGRHGEWAEGRGYNDTRPSDRVYDLVEVGVAMQACFPGSPMVYYGTELGMWSADDPENRQPMAWPDLAPIAGVSDRLPEGLRDRVGRWLHVRSDGEWGEVLRLGCFDFVKTESDDVVSWIRQLDGRRVVFVANRGDEHFDAGDVLRETLVPFNPGGNVSEARIAPRSARVWGIEGGHGEAIDVR